MTRRTSETYQRVADSATRWVLDQVRWDDGPWVPWSVDGSDEQDPPWDRDGLHSGIGGLALLLAEVRLTRPWTGEEQRLADAIADRLRGQVATQTDCTFFDGLVSTLGALLALDADGTDAVVARLLALAEADGWPQTVATGPRYAEGARVTDLTLGTAGVLIGALWAHRHDVPGAADLAGLAADVALAEAEERTTGLTWRMVAARFWTAEPGAEMPNLSHGTAGVAAALAVAGAELGRPDLVAAAHRGAEHLVSLGDLTDDGAGLVVRRQLVHNEDLDEVTHTWCHGGTGTSSLFLALDRAGVADVAGESPLTWHRRSLHAVATSGLPARLHPGFWDNDGRCCGTTGVGDVFLDSWRRTGDEQQLAFALHLADTLVDRALLQDGQACWRFVEHRADPPLLPPGVGWMQGTAGIAAYLHRAARVVEHGPAAGWLPRMDTWWTAPAAPTAGSTVRG